MSDTENSAIAADSVDVPEPSEYMVALDIPGVPDHVTVVIDFFYDDFWCIHAYDDSPRGDDGGQGPVYSLAIPTTPDGQLQLVRTPGGYDDSWRSDRTSTRDPGDPIE